MKRTVTALYETRAEAERVRDALQAAHLGGDVEIRDQPADTDATESHEHRTFGEWLTGLFGGHHDRHLYAEGLRRGHVLLAAKVDDLNETRAAEIMDNAAPVNLGAAEQDWRQEGWNPAPPTPPAAAPPIETAWTPPAARPPIETARNDTAPDRGPYAEPAAVGSSVRAYTLSS